MQEPNTNDLIQQKSLLIIQAQFQKMMGQPAEAARLFLEAAALEEQLAKEFKQAGKLKDAAISFISAASCYTNAGQPIPAEISAETLSYRFSP